MKANGLLVAAVVGMLAASSAYADHQGINNATYASRYRNPAPPTANQAKPEIQVATMAKSSSQTGTSATASHPFGPPRPRAVHSR